MHDVVAPIGERLDGPVQAGNPHTHACVEGQLDLRRGGESPVDVRVRADHFDLEARYPALAQLVERVRDAVHRADAVRDERHPARL